MVDNFIYEVLAQAKCKHHGGSNEKARNIKKVNGLLRYIYPKSYRKELLDITNQNKRVISKFIQMDL